MHSKPNICGEIKARTLRCTTRSKAFTNGQIFIYQLVTFYDRFCSSRYFEGGVSSVYLWDLDHGFAGVILIKKGDVYSDTNACTCS